MIFGSFFMAMPLAIIGHNFEEVWVSFQKEKQRAAAKSRRQRGIHIEIKPLGVNTKDDTKRDFVRHYFDLVLTGNEIRCQMRATGTSIYQSSMTMDGGLGEGEDDMHHVSGQHTNTLNAMLRFHAAYHILRQDVITLTKDTPLREKVKLANRRFMSLQMASKVKRKVKDVRRKMEVRSRCRSYVFRTMENPDSSMAAWLIHKVLITSVLISIILFCLQSAPELNIYGPTTKACAHQFREYCKRHFDRWKNSRNVLTDPACFPHYFYDGTYHHHYGHKNCSSSDLRTGLVDLTTTEKEKCKSENVLGKGSSHKYHDFPTTYEYSPFCFSCDDSCAGDTVGTSRNISQYYTPPNIPSNAYALPIASTEEELINPADIKAGPFIRSYGFRSHDERDTVSYSTKSSMDTSLEYKTNIARTRAAYNDYPRVYPICERPQCIDNQKDMLIVDMSSHWFWLEVCFNIFFTFELILKLVVYPDLSQWFLGADAVVNLVDVVAVVPFWLELFVSLRSHGYFYSEPLAGEVSLVKFLRMLAVLRVFKLVRNFDGASVIVQTVNSAWDRLILPFFYLMVFVVVFGCLVYSIENDEKLGADQPFPEMATACWFVLVTMTTTGYGKVVPTRMATKLVAIVVMISGNFYMAMPLTIGKWCCCCCCCCCLSLFVVCCCCLLFLFLLLLLLLFSFFFSILSCRP